MLKQAGAVEAVPDMNNLERSLTENRTDESDNDVVSHQPRLWPTETASQPFVCVEEV
jgi:hypothetical protein